MSHPGGLGQGEQLLRVGGAGGANEAFTATYRFQPASRVTPAVVLAIRYALTFDEAGTGAQGSAVNPAP
jgi:hypothetical protein